VQIPILSGIYADGSPDFRTSYPRNLVPVPKATGLSAGYLKPAPGLVPFATAPGVGRGAIVRDGVVYRVQGTSLVSVGSDGSVSTLGTIPGTDNVTMDYSFDLLSISANGNLYYWDAINGVRQVTDPDLGTVLDHIWVDGYFMTTDGRFLIVTELTDPFSVNPLKYGSSEADPDPIVCLVKLRNEPYAFNRYTTEVFENVGGSNFPFQRIEGAQIQRGTFGSQTACVFSDSVAFLGSGEQETPGIFLVDSGRQVKVSTHEIDLILAQYSEEQLADAVLEQKLDRQHRNLLVHLPDRTLVYDAASSTELGQPVWYSLHSGIDGTGEYRARHFTWCYDKWLAADTQSGVIVETDESLASHYGQKVGWEFQTALIYNESRGAIINSLELVGLPGRAAFGDNPTIWQSYTDDGVSYSQEHPVSAGIQGQRQKRVQWRKCGKMRNYRSYRFRGTSDVMMPVARLEANLEPLNG